MARVSAEVGSSFGVEKMSRVAACKRIAKTEGLVPRDLALTLIRDAEKKGVRLDERLREVQEWTVLDSKDRAFIRELVYGTIRWRGRLDRALADCLSGNPEGLPHAIRNILRLGAYQVLMMDRVPNWAAVNEAVEQTRRKGFDGLAKMVNAVLRAFARSATTDSQSEITAHKDVDDLAYRQSHPRWMVQRWADQLGLEVAARVCRANNEPAPLTLRVNRRRATVKTLKNALEQSGVQVAQGDFWPESLVIRGGPPIKQLPGFRDGWFSIQDQAASWMTQLMDVRSGDLVWDVCAGPGGKTVHIAERMNDLGFILATDTHVNRLRKVIENSRRLGVGSVRAVRANATSGLVKDSVFDAVLVDAPCSGFGVLRRHPEAKWNKEKADLLRMSTIQNRILRKVSCSVRLGGSVLYCGCSNEVEETYGVVRAFNESSEGADFKVEDLSVAIPDIPPSCIIENGCFQVRPGDVGSDGFFAVRWRRERFSGSD